METQEDLGLDIERKSKRLKIHHQITSSNEVTTLLVTAYNDQQSINPLIYLPYALWTNIFSWLCMSEIFDLKNTNRFFKKIVIDQMEHLGFWEMRLQKQFPRYSDYWIKTQTNPLLYQGKFNQLFFKAWHRDYATLTKLFRDAISLIKENNVGGLQQLFAEISESNQKVLLKSVDNSNLTLLGWACELKCLSIIEFLTTLSDIDLTQTNKQGYSLLHWAAENNYGDLIQTLVETYQCDMNDPTENKDQVNACGVAAYNGHLSIVQYLVNKGVALLCDKKSVNNPLHQAARGGHWEILEYLIEVGGDEALYEKGDWGYTILHYAVENGHLHVVIQLLNKTNHKFDLTVADAGGCTPAQLAVAEGYLEILKLLKSKGVNLHREVDSKGHGLMYIAVSQNQLIIVNYLLTLNFHLDEHDAIGGTLLHVACSNNASDVAEYLVNQKKFSVGTSDNSGITPLHWTVWMGNVKLTNFLIGKGANIHTIMRDERTILNYAASSNLEMMQFLLEHHYVTQNALLDNLSQLLESAVKEGDLLLVIFLSQQNVEIFSAKKRFLLKLAATEERLEVYYWLITQGATRVKNNRELFETVVPIPEDVPKNMRHLLSKEIECYTNAIAQQDLFRIETNISWQEQYESLDEKLRNPASLENVDKSFRGWAKFWAGYFYTRNYEKAHDQLKVVCKTQLPLEIDNDLAPQNFLAASVT